MTRIINEQKRAEKWAVGGGWCSVTVNSLVTASAAVNRVESDAIVNTVADVVQGVLEVKMFRENVDFSSCVVFAGVWCVCSVM